MPHAMLLITVVLFSSLLTGCKLTVPDIEGCVTLASGGAFCRKMVSHKERMVSKGTWDVHKIGTISLSPSDFGEVVKFIRKVCAQKNCTDAEVKQVDRHLQSMHHLFSDDN